MVTKPMIKRFKLNQSQIKEYYNILENVLKESEIPYWHYSIGEHTDECVCFEYSSGKWNVYEGCRGKKIHKRQFDSFMEASRVLFKAVSVGEEKYNQMEQMLSKQMVLMKRKVADPLAAYRIGSAAAARWSINAPKVLKK